MRQSKIRKPRYCHLCRKEHEMTAAELKAHAPWEKVKKAEEVRERLAKKAAEEVKDAQTDTE